MSEDLIRRSDAIDVIEITPFEDYGDYIKAREIIENLPTIDVCSPKGEINAHKR